MSKKILLRLAYGICYALAIAIMLGWFWTMNSVTSAPLTQIPETENTIPYNNHGAIHYITPLQDKALDGLVPIGFVVALIGRSIRSKINERDPSAHLG